MCAECMKKCCLGGKNSVVKGLRSLLFAGTNISELGMQRIWRVLILAF